MEFDTFTPGMNKISGEYVIETTLGLILHRSKYVMPLFFFAGNFYLFIQVMKEEGSAQKKMLGMLLAFSLWSLG